MTAPFTAPAPDRRCGTCKWWVKDPHPSNQTADTAWGECEWPKAHRPASMPREGVEMDEDEGTDCSQWSDGAEALGGGR